MPMENSDKKIQVAICAKNFLFRLGIKTVISVIGIEPELNEFNNTDELNTFFKKNRQLNFLIIDIDLLSNYNTNFIKKVKYKCPYCKMLFIGNSINKFNYQKQVCNEDTQKEVLEKFQDFFFEPEEPENSEDLKPILSSREIDVLKTIALGYSNKEIADKLFISVNTVITHRKNITEKLGIKTIAGLTVYAIMNDLIKTDEVKY